MMGKRVNIIIFTISLILSLTIITAQNEVQDEQIQFIRGDANSDGKVDISDSAFLFNYLYKGGRAPQCRDFADVNDDGKVDLTDGVYLNNHLFRSGEPPKPPYPFQGLDTTQDELTCGGEGQGAGLGGVIDIASILVSVCDGEYINAEVKGRIDLPPNERQFCINFGSPNYDIIIKLWEDDTIFGDDEISSKTIRNVISDNCRDIQFDVSISDVDFGPHAGGTEGNTIEVYAVATLKKDGNSLGSVTESANNNIDILGNCQCRPLNVAGDENRLKQGPCCTTARPYLLAPLNTQPPNRNDGYQCIGAQSPQGGQRIDFADYSCNGQDPQEHTDTRTSANCGACSYCIQGDQRCRQYNGREVCGTINCNNLDTDCRDYSDVDKVCIQGACTQQQCQYTDFQQGTNCNNNAGRCDGGGSCGQCQDTNGVMCSNNDEYYTRVCGPVTEPRQLKQDCGDSACNNWQRGCDNDDVIERRTCSNKGCENNACFDTQDVQDRVVQDCGSNDCGIWESYCNGNELREKRTCFDRGCLNRQCFANPNQENRLIENCQNGCETLSSTTARCRGAPPPPTCNDGIKNQDETDIDCGGSKCPKCQNGRTCSASPDCQSNYCNPTTRKCENAPPCTNDCTTQDATRCASSTAQQTCGNFDADTCLEWGSSITCPSGCSATRNQCNKPDLTITSFLLQYPRTNTVNRDQRLSLVFTIKNIGTVTANNIFWKLVQPDHSDQTNEGRPISSLKPGQLTSVFMPSSYSRAGQQQIRVNVDYQNQINELNENNNQKELTITVV